MYTGCIYYYVCLIVIEVISNAICMTFVIIGYAFGNVIFGVLLCVSIVDLSVVK